MENIIHIKEEIECDIATAFKMFTQNRFLESWLTVKAEVDPQVGGKYELFWDPENPENDSTIGCKITGFERNSFISFDWKGPIQFRAFMNLVDPLTHVIVFFVLHNTQSDKTIIHLFHTGWRKSPEWQEAREYFERAWSRSLFNLREKIKLLEFEK